jgi:hypothetical protein
VRADEIRIPEPCHEDWDRMLPDERGWHCKLCSKHVRDLSRMPEAQVRALLDSGADICVAYNVGSNGEIVFAPEPVVPIARLVRRPRAAAIAPAAAGLALALAACTPHGEEQQPRLESSEHPTRLQSAPVIPDRRPEPEPFIEVEVEAPEVEPPHADEPCDTTEPTAQPDTPTRPHVRGRIAPVRAVKGKPARPIF